MASYSGLVWFIVYRVRICVVHDFMNARKIEKAHVQVPSMGCCGKMLKRVLTWLASVLQAAVAIAIIYMVLSKLYKVDPPAVTSQDNINAAFPGWVSQGRIIIIPALPLAVEQDAIRDAVATSILASPKA